MRQSVLRFDVLVITVVMFMVPLPAYAYIDPGAGSMVTTAILGFFAAIAYTFRKYFYRLKDLLSGKKNSAGVKGRKTDA